MVTSALMFGGAPLAYAQTDDAEQLSEVVVTGSLLRSGFNTPTPVTIVGADLIEKRAPSAPADLLREVPSLKVDSGSGNTGVAQRTSVGQANINFYGLTADRSLLLIDGQRQAPTNSVGNVDVNIVPVSMIERVETITGGASATYGADAVAGVANFILRERLDGFKVDASYSQTGHNDKQVSSINLAFGHSFGERANLVIGVDLTRDEGVDSVYDRDWGREEPGLFSYGNASAARGTNPARLWVNNYEQKSTTGGSIITGCTPTPCPASLTSVAFDDSGNPYTFVRGTTTSASTNMYGNTSNYGSNSNSLQSLSAPYDRAASLAKFTYDFNEHAKLKLTAGYYILNSEELATVIQSTGRTIPISNPFIPAATRAAMTTAGVTSITIGRINYDVGTIYTGQDNTAYSASAALSGELAGTWSYDAYYKHSTVDSDGFTDGLRTADLNAALSNCTVLTNASAGCVGLDPFGQNQASQEALNYLHQYEQGTLLRSTQNATQVIVSGEPLSTWAGPVGVGFGMHYRTEFMFRRLQDDSITFSTGGYSSGFAFGNYGAFQAARHVNEYFGEANIPLAKDAPLMKSVNANLGYRNLNYSDDGAWNTWKAGLTWDLTDQVRLRATRSRDIRAPSLFTQYGTTATANTSGINDPRDGQPVNYGNPLPGTGLANFNLRPEVSMNTTAGIVYQPIWASGLRMSLDYFRFDIRDVIIRTLQQQVVNACLVDHVTDVCSFITFDGTGEIVKVDSSRFNYNLLNVAGYNAEVDYKFPVEFLGGQWDVRALVTYMDKYATTDRFSGVVYNDIGTYDAGSPRFQYNLLVSYARGAFSTTASIRGFRGVKYSSTSNGLFVGPDDPLYFSTVNSTTTQPCPGGAATCQWYQTATNSISQNKFPGATYVNWSAQYKFGAGSRWEDFQIYAKVDNVMDKDPPDYAYAALGSGNFYEVVGRTYKLGFRLGF